VAYGMNMNQICRSRPNIGNRVTAALLLFSVQFAGQTRGAANDVIYKNDQYTFSIHRLAGDTLCRHNQSLHGVEIVPAGRSCRKSEKGTHYWLEGYWNTAGYKSPREEAETECRDFNIASSEKKMGGLETVRCDAGEKPPKLMEKLFIAQGASWDGTNTGVRNYTLSVYCAPGDEHICENSIHDILEHVAAVPTH
jgi:hypothetical protein